MRTTQDFIDDVNSSMMNFLKETIVSVQALSKVDVEGKEELKALENRLEAALAIIDGSQELKSEAEFMEVKGRWELTPEEEKLTTHYDKIIHFLQHDTKKTDQMMAEELGCDQSTLAGFIKKRIHT